MVKVAAATTPAPLEEEPSSWIQTQTSQLPLPRSQFSSELQALDKPDLLKRCFLWASRFLRFLASSGVGKKTEDSVLRAMEGEACLLLGALGMSYLSGDYACLLWWLEDWR